MLVTSVGASYQAIVNSGVPAVAKPNVGDITVSPGFPLSNHVIHTNCCKWQGGQGEVVSTITMQSAFFIQYTVSQSPSKLS